MKLLVKVPPHKELLISTDQEVDIGSPFLKITAPQRTTVPVAKTLGITPDKIFLHLKKFVGDAIKKGDVLAEAKSFFSNKQFLSDVDGILTEIDHQTGSVVVEAMGNESDVFNCFFKGTVVNVSPDVLELKVETGTEYPIFPVETYTGGLVTYHRGNVLTEEDIENKFIFSEEIIPYDQIKLETLGARGFITINELKKPTELPTIKMKQVDHFEELFKARFPYCILGPDHTTMYFYK